MVTNSLPARHSPAPSTWQQELAQAITDPLVLLRELGLTPEALGESAEALAAAARVFPVRVPRSLLARMRPGDPRDPLLLQVLARGVEQELRPGYGADPLNESAARRAPGLLQKYAGRALLVTTGACAVHCRYCFRRDYDYAADTADADEHRWDSALAALEKDPSIEELILSGGDPLSLSNGRLDSLLRRLVALPQLRRVRVHTRTPIVLPSRVDAGLTQLLGALPLALVVVVHANHPAEIDAEAQRALRALRATGATVLNQSVLLAGINDSVAVLEALSRRLFDAGTLPYYLHLLDRVHGTAQFEVPEDRAVSLVEALNGQLPGYLVPRLVREVAGMPGKTPIATHRGGAH